MTGRQGRRRKQLLERKRYWEVKENALDLALWRKRFGKGYGPIMRKRNKKKCVENFGEKTRRIIDHFLDLRVDIRLILKWL